MKIIPNLVFKRIVFGILVSCFVVSCIPPKTTAVTYIQASTEGEQTINSFPNITIGQPKSVVIKEYQSTFENLYANIDSFKKEFVTSTELIINPNHRFIEAQQRLDIEEIQFGKDSKLGFFIPLPSPFLIDFSKNYCSIKITFKIINSAGHTVLNGVLVTGTSDGHDLFSRKKRVVAAISHAEQKLADLILGKLPASEMKIIATPQKK